jgi:hypothetical protein
MHAIGSMNLVPSGKNGVVGRSVAVQAGAHFVSQPLTPEDTTQPVMRASIEVIASRLLMIGADWNAAWRVLCNNFLKSVLAE